MRGRCVNDNHNLMQTVDAQLQAYRQAQQQKFKEEKLVSYLGELENYHQQVETLDRKLETFKQYFYNIFNNKFVESTEDIESDLRKLACYISSMSKDLPESIALMHFEQELEKFKDLIVQLRQDQSALSSVCFNRYTIPLVDSFWNYKFRLENYIKVCKEGEDASSDVNNNTNNHPNLEPQWAEYVDVLNSNFSNSIGHYLSPLDKKILATIKPEHYLFYIFGKDIKSANERIEEFVSCVVLGKKEETEKRLKQDPRVALFKAQVLDESGYLLYGTGLQCALALGDVSLDGKNGEMAELIIRYLKTLPSGAGEKAIYVQTKEQFPNGWKEEEEERAKRDLEALEKVFASISASKKNQDCQQALQAFRDYLKPKRIITSGKCFNHKLLVHALEQYRSLIFASHAQNQNNLFSSTPYSNYRKVDLFWCQVIGLIQSYLPVCDVQIMCSGLNAVAQGQKPFTRITAFADGRSYFPLTPDGLGHAFAVYSNQDAAKFTSFPDPCSHSLDAWNTIKNVKNEALERILSNQDVKPRLKL